MPQFHVPLTDFDDEIFRLVTRDSINRIAGQAAVAGLERFAVESPKIERYANLLDLTALQGPKHRLKCYVKLGDREFTALKNFRNEIKSANLSSVHPRNDNVLQSVLASEVANFCGIHAEDVLHNGIIDKHVLIDFFEKNIELDEEKI